VFFVILNNMNQLQQFSQLPFAHHAYGIESSHSVFSELQEVLPLDHFSYVVQRKYETFKVDDARMIKSLQSEKTEKASLFILEFSLINKEAQNALLKVLEEPASQTYFFLVFPNTKKLLPTLQSRLQIVMHTPQETGDLRISAKELSEIDLQKRFNLIKDLTDKKSELKITKSEVLHFLNDCEVYFHAQKKHDVLPVLFQARESMNANGSSVKMILEMVVIHF
jgi:hypothetical protein